MLAKHPRNVFGGRSFSIASRCPCRDMKVILPRQVATHASKQHQPEDKLAADSSPKFNKDLLGPQWANRGRLSDDMLSSLLALPGTRGMNDLRDRAESLATWKMALQRGTIPKLDELKWPQEPFKTKFATALTAMEMPRFTRRYPAILDTLMKQMIGLVNDFETQLAAEEESQSKQQQQQQQQPQNQQQQQQQQQPGQGQGGEGQKQEKGEKGEEQEEQEGQGTGEESKEMELDEEMMKQMMEEMKEMKEKQKEGQNQKPSEKKIKIQLELKAEEGAPDENAQKMQLKIEQAAENIVSNFQKQMEEVMKNLEEGEMAFDDLGDLLEGSDGFDLTRGTWRKSGWRELAELRRVLEECVELRQLVRELGRGGGKGPLRRAPEQIESPGLPPGVIRSPLQPEEVRGLTRSGELSRMLPSEVALLAHGWPKKVRDDGKNDQGDKEDQEESSSSGEFDSQVYYLPGAHAARMLHRVRRAERMLMSYDRTGWLDDQPSKLTDRTEIRPAAELGPIILCLDTSGSMSGARETVAKALALECLRGAMRQRRACFLYAFSGPQDVQELELKVDMDSLDSLLDFLSCSFMGGTDVDQPLKLSLERLKTRPEWAMADILMVTDGEIPMPDASILSTIETMSETVGLKVHGLLVASQVTEPMKKLCTKLHTFKSWSAVGGKDYMN